MKKTTRQQLIQWTVTGLNVAHIIGSNLPGRGSTTLQTVFQTLGTIAAVRAALWQSTTDPLRQYINQYGMEKHTNETFVRIFFGTELHTKFTLFVVRINDYKDLIDAQGPLGRFVFTKSDYSSEHDSTFYMGSNVQMTEVLEGLWAQYQGRLHVTVTPTIYGNGITEFSTFQNIDSPLFGEASGRMDQLVARHRKCQEQKIPRSYMCYGPPGTGKTSFAMKFATKLGNRTLKLAATSLSHISLKEIEYLLQHLRPEFLVIDDVDKMQAGNALPTLLEIVQRFKNGDGQTTLIMTANSINSFDPGFFRPNRIDTWLEFKLPELGERKDVLRSYSLQMGVAVECPVSWVEQLAIESEGLSHDYLRELVSELKQCGSFEEVITLTKLMKKLLPKAESAEASSKEDEEGKG